MMSAVELGATPQMREPTSKMNSAERYTHLIE
jgi:hypothetical protein